MPGPTSRCRSATNAWTSVCGTVGSGLTRTERWRPRQAFELEVHRSGAGVTLDILEGALSGQVVPSAQYPDEPYAPSLDAGHLVLKRHGG
jgi:hypothetical protein